ncbi:FAD binding domain containing protein [Drepanopeziza brunnea f. sp. 'multigermtubi' MB_m1]|uniref:FAD binding domain containing protein n=1 Tax=Marssonina brunnea f. sp. multigermtubi (strain MB_m1) TaxID=1072389 RepID=K1WXT9_MARBU|nr:FAD binding domain containing protein [Drepanopeziza brunnea f. sp. 'multigermtubi' MB_m1]EKD17377.1 FAD binding domain containing protein [Drepanopeziza brunnea f. sp. 'multigermtubi' MB_m1]
MRLAVLVIFMTSSSLVSTSSRMPKQDAIVDSVQKIDSFKPNDALALLALQGLENIRKSETSSTSSRAQKCSLKNAAIRRDWDHLSAADRISYTDAVLCLMSKPSILNQTQYPGARSRYDDFVVVHINQTTSIHGTGNFLGWHRYYVHTYEQALRRECGYRGYQPASPNRPKSKYDLANDYLTTSMSGDGAFFLHNGTLAGAGYIFLPSGKGGGCVTSGPFKDMQVNLGPIAPAMDGIVPSNSTFAYNPRCLRRDIGTQASSTWLKMEDILSLIVESPDVFTFQNRMQGDFATGFLGVHGAGHFTMDGDPGADFFASPGDPAFFLHHAMVDRTWVIWESLKWPARVKEVAGTLTVLNIPPSANATLADLQNLGPLAGDIALGDLLSPLSGPFCYIYL